jgi:hypothetical protein
MRAWRDGPVGVRVIEHQAASGNTLNRGTWDAAMTTN